MKVLVTCPPMLRRIDEFRSIFAEKDIELILPNVVQTMTEEELIEILPSCDGWIIGDDPATKLVFESGKAGNLKAAVKWGVGVDNVDFSACKELNIPIINTPNMFGAEVATVAVSYVLGLARQTYFIDREIRKGNWAKPAGRSLKDKVVALIGFGDIGKASARFLKAFDMKINVYDPFAHRSEYDEKNYHFYSFPEKLQEADYVVITCALNDSTRNMINESSIALMKNGVNIVNVSRGGIIDESALLNEIKSGKIEAVALDVFENEPLPLTSPFVEMDNCILGSHNGSNTIEGVQRASLQAINYLFDFLNIK
jgi:D-3-phosphoglycerate dehydrogenase